MNEETINEPAAAVAVTEETVASLPADASTDADVKNYNLISKEFWNYSAERIIKTFAMTASGILSTTGVFVIANPASANVFAEIGWGYIASVAGLSALNSFLVALSNFKDVIAVKKENSI